MRSILDVVADQCPDLFLAEEKVKDRLFSSSWFCYKYQIHRLINIMPEEVGADLSGLAEGGLIRYSPATAAHWVSQYVNGLCLWVSRLRDDLPYTEGNLKFIRFTESRLPDKRPVLFRGKIGITISALARENDISLNEAAYLLMRIVENE